MALTKKWQLREYNDDHLPYVDKMPNLLRKLISHMEFDSTEAIENFLNPKLKHLGDPFVLPDMQRAVDRILLAAERQETVLIFGDYDVDGVTSVCLLSKILASYGIDAKTFIPKRTSEGYGLSEAALRRCFDCGDLPTLLVTVDCGTASVDDINSLVNQGVDVVVIDHHEMTNLGRPKAHAIVNPKLGDTHHYLCAAGVVFKVGHALLKQKPVPCLDLKRLTDLVAVATISDIVPLVDENRILVRHGLKMLPYTDNEGLKALQEVTGLMDNDRVTSLDVGFRIGPRINAAGRMDCPEDALSTLECESCDLAKKMAAQLDVYNRERQLTEQTIHKNAIDLIEQNPEIKNKPVIVVADKNWHPGVVGIVASRLMREYHKPAFVISIDNDGVGKASGRSIPGVSLVEAIDACRDYLINGGGHEMAAGLTIKEEYIDQFRNYFSEFVTEKLGDEAIRPTINIAADVTFDELTMNFLDSYALLQPFGNSNPQPIFMACCVKLAKPIRFLKNGHAIFTFEQGFIQHEGIFFGLGERELPPEPWDIAFHIDRNSFRGRNYLQLIVQDIRAAESEK